jgi:hypothetical protein
MLEMFKTKPAQRAPAGPEAPGSNSAGDTKAAP